MGDKKEESIGKKSLKFKLIVIGIAVFTLFAIIIAMMNYGSSGSGSDKMTITSSKFKITEITERNYIYTYEESLDLTTNSIYFLLNGNSGEVYTVEIHIYTGEELSFEYDEENKIKMPTFASYQERFNKTIDFKFTTTDNMSSEEIEAEANKYKYDLTMDFNNNKETIVYIRISENMNVNMFSFIFE